MFLTDVEKRMLDGEMGYPYQKSMEILIAMGEAFEAEKMLEIESAHLPAVTIRGAGEIGIKFAQELADKGGRFKVFTTTNIISTDLLQWEKLGIPEEDQKLQMRMLDNITRMGGILYNTCTPYLLGHVPRLGAHVAWGESSAVAYVNSVLGARTNREGGPGALAAALTGRVPAYGYHLKENRYATIVINVTCPLEDLFDYGVLGYFAGKIAGVKNVVFTGIDRVSNDELKQIAAIMPIMGATSLFHVAGITPEAPTLEEALGGRQPEMEIEFGLKEKEETIAYMNREKSDNVDWVVIGCPHVSIEELRQVAEGLKGKKVHPNVTMWINCALPVVTMAETLGYTDIIAEAGALIVTDTCPINLTKNTLQKLGFTGFATNSAKMNQHIPGMNNMTTHCGTLERVIQAAVSGVWR